MSVRATAGHLLCCVKTDLYWTKCCISTEEIVIVCESCTDTCPQSHMHLLYTHAVKQWSPFISYPLRLQTLQDEDYMSFVGRNTNPWCASGHVWERKVLSLVLVISAMSSCCSVGENFVWAVSIWENRQPGNFITNLDTIGLQRKDKKKETWFMALWAIFTPHLLTNVAQGDCTKKV